MTSILIFPQKPDESTSNSRMTSWLRSGMLQLCLSTLPRSDPNAAKLRMVVYMTSSTLLTTYMTLRRLRSWILSSNYKVHRYLLDMNSNMIWIDYSESSQRPHASRDLQE